MTMILMTIGLMCFLKFIRNYRIKTEKIVLNNSFNKNVFYCVVLKQKTCFIEKKNIFLNKLTSLTGRRVLS